MRFCHIFRIAIQARVASLSSASQCSVAGSGDSHTTRNALISVFVILLVGLVVGGVVFYWCRSKRNVPYEDMTAQYMNNPLAQQASIDIVPTGWRKFLNDSSRWKSILICMIVAVTGGATAEKGGHLSFANPLSANETAEEPRYVEFSETKNDATLNLDLSGAYDAPTVQENPTYGLPPKPDN